MKNTFFIKTIFLLVILFGSYHAEAQLGRLGVKKPKVKKPVVKKPTLKQTGSPKANTDTKETTSGTTNNNNSSEKEASDTPKYNAEDPVYKQYSKAKMNIKSIASEFESSGWTQKEDRIQEYLDKLKEQLAFLKENGEGDKNYYREFEASHKSYTEKLKTGVERTKVLDEYGSFFRNVIGFDKGIKEYPAKKKAYQEGPYQSKYIDGLIVKADAHVEELAAEKAANNLMKLVPDSKITGPATDYHKNNMGTIAFSNETIELKNVDESKIKKSFDYGENIRFRVFMQKPIYNTVAELINADGGKQGKNCEPRSKLRYYLDGKLIHEEGYGGSRMYNPAILYFKEGAEVIGYWTSYRGTLFMQDKFAHDEQEHFKAFLLKARKNLTGKHQLKVEILAYDAENREVEARQAIMATGEITIDFSKKPDLRNNPVICMPKSGSNSTALSLLKNHMKNSNYSRISLLSYVEEKPARVIKAEIGYKDKEDGKCYKYYVSYEQHFNYTRGVFDGPLDPTYASEKEEIFCDCLK